MTRRIAVLLGVLAAALAAGAAGARVADDPGVTSDSVLLGGTAPISGEASAASAVARGADLYFRWINDTQRGVLGRKITYRYEDDGYEPARTVQVVRKLVQEDKVFAIFNTLGTANNLAIRDFLNQSQVPQLFVASGYSGWGRDARKYPYTIGYIPSYVAEATVYARHLLKTKPRARIAVLYQDDEYGKDMLAGFKSGLGRKASQVVKAVGYDPTQPDVNSQVAELRETKADVFMNFAFGKFAIQAFINLSKLGWRPQVFVNAVASTTNILTLASLTAGRKTTTGTISVVFGKDPADRGWASDPGIKLFERIMKRYGQGSADNLKNGYFVAGMAAAFTMVDTLRKAGKALSRASLVKASRNLNETNNPFLLPGIVVKTGANDPYPLEQMQLQRWNGTRWIRFGPIVTAKS